MKIILTTALLILSTSALAQGQGCMWTDTRATCFAQLPREAKTSTCTLNITGDAAGKKIEKTKEVKLEPGQVDRVEIDGKGFTGASVKFQCK